MQPKPDFQDDLDVGHAADDAFAAAADTAGLPHHEPMAPHEDLSPPPPMEPLEVGEPEPMSTHARLQALDDLPEIPSRSDNPVGDLQANAETAFAQHSLPKITIHIFCDNPETAAICDRATRDRRLSRAATQVRPGGLASAVAHYQNEPTPSLVMVESGEPKEVMLGLLDQLAEVCDPGTKVIVIGAANDIALYRELMRRGVSEYLVPPLQPLQLISAVMTLYSDPAAPFSGRQVAFVSAKGGSGSSTLAHNFAWSLAERMQTNTVLVDFDLPFGTAGLDFNQDPLQGVATALTQPDRLDPVLLERMMARCGERLSLFAAPATLEEDYDSPSEAYDEVAAKIRATAPFVVLDMPHQWTAWIRRMLLGSDEVVVVATTDLASLRNGKNIIDLLKAHRQNDAPPRLVLNQVGVPGRPEIPPKDFAEALGIQPALVIEFDPKLFGKAANNGQMLAEVGAASKAADGIDQLAQLISRREPAKAVRRGGGLAALFKRK